MPHTARKWCLFTFDDDPNDETDLPIKLNPDDPDVSGWILSFTKTGIYAVVANFGINDYKTMEYIEGHSEKQ
ncbi:hypothetical protein KL906_004752 [Ogataea polymorpha]|nr:hypothetical protein KL906_004752 [Ogataea polymorpha]KAG7913906.1 hypothetical protein KL927_004885 [Ogataea polymorpha]